MKRSLSLILSFMLLLGMVMPGNVKAASFSKVGGWLESLYAELPGLTDADITAVSYSGPMSGQLKGEDFTYLVRSTEAGVRIDIPGLKPGTYSLSVTTASGTVTHEGIEVLSHDRSGFAHFNYTQGVGAYNDDGTLKEGAIVLYVTEENKNTVSVTSSDGTTVSGIGNILNSSGQDTGSGTSSKGGKANTNQGILKKLALDGTPLVVRIVGTVSTPEGLTAWGSIDYGGNEDDNGAMARMQSCRDITVEGIGNNGVINGWGFSVISQTGNYNAGLGRNFEFRNLTFTNVPEDCIGLEGTGSGTPADPIERCWVHNCAFYGPTNVKDASDDQDKGEGDGAVDFKRGNYFTMSYCYYDTYHKTNLIGGSDSNQQYHVTWHHNWYRNCHSRAPLGRQADMHIYNNVFENQASYCMSLRANVYIFSEYNVYNNCKKVSEGKGGGVCKALGNEYNNCTGQTNSDIITVTDRSQTVNSKNKYANFDTNPDLSYIPSGNYLLLTDTDAVEKTVKSSAGPMDCTYLKPGASAPEIPDSTDPTQPTEPEGGVGSGVETPSVIPEGSYIHNFTENGKESAFFTINGNLSTSKGTVDYNGQHLTQCLKIESSTSISFTAPEEGMLVMIFGTEKDPAAGKKIKLNGKDQIVGSDCTLTLHIGAGSHTITKNKTMHLFYLVYIPASANQSHSYISVVTAPTCTTQGYTTHTCATCGNIYVDSYVSATGHSHSESVTKVPTCEYAGIKTFTCPCGDSYIEEIPALGHSYSSVVTIPTCTAQGYTTHTCATCGNVKVDSYVEAIGHSHSESVTKTPTCEYAGIKTFTCPCGDSYIEEIPALGHSYSSVVTIPTCTAQGYTTHTCATCGNSYVDAFVAATGHSYISEIIAPTCTFAGYTNYSCVTCDSSYVDSFVNAIGHSFGDWVTVTEPNEFTNGVQERLCACGEKETQEIPNNPFTDVGEGNQFKNFILWGYYNNIVLGKTADIFQPDGTVTRGQFLIMLWRAAGKPEPTQFQSFPDVTENSSFYKTVCWAVEKGITNGKKDGTFGVNDPCTRGHVALFLYRFAGTPDISGNYRFEDVTGGTYYHAVCWLAETGITSGQSDGNFGLTNPCKRAHAMKFLYLYLN